MVGFVDSLRGILLPPQAEEAAEQERNTADELLALLKEKEAEISQLRCASSHFFFFSFLFSFCGE